MPPPPPPFLSFHVLRSPAHSLRVENYISDIMATLLVELDTVPQPLLDAVLENLLEPKKTERPAAYALARSLIARCAKPLNKPVYEFLQGCLPSSIASRTESELRDEWPQLLIELTSIDPEMVSYLLPQLQELTAMEDESIRIQGTRELAPLICLLHLRFLTSWSPRHDQAQLHPQLPACHAHLPL